MSCVWMVFLGDYGVLTTCAEELEDALQSVRATAADAGTYEYLLEIGSLTCLYRQSCSGSRGERLSLVT